MRVMYLHSNSAKFSIRVGSKRSLLLAVFAVSSIAALAFVPRFALPRAAATGLNSTKSKQQQGCCGDQPPSTLHRMVGTYYRTDGNWKSTMILNNKGSHSITVAPTLYNQFGQSFTPPAVTVDGLSPLEVDLNALAKIAGPQFKAGSIEYSYTGKLLEMGGGLKIVNSEKSLVFDEQMLEPGMKLSTSQLESVFAIPYESARVDLILTNTTPDLLVIEATLNLNFIKLPLPFVLGPHQSRTFPLPRLLTSRSNAGAITLKHNGEKGALLAMLHIREVDRGFSATVNFVNYAKGQTTSLQGAGLRLGNINGDVLNPVVVVRNTEEETTTITARAPYTKTDRSSGVITLPQLTLGPGEIGFLDTSNPQLRESDFDTAGLEIEYTGIPGSVIASAYSVSKSGNQVFGLPLKDPKGGLSSTGGYPWFIKGSSSTVVFIKNTTTETQHFTLDIIYPGGQWGSNLRTLDPGQTFKLDVREVRDSQMKGSEGNTVPLDATEGHISWSAHGKGSHKTLIGRAQTVDVATGLASTYECQRCCGNSIYNWRMTPEVVTAFTGYTEQFTAQEQDIDCYREHVSSWFNVPAVYSSANQNVATVDGSGMATAIGAGSTTIGGSWSAVNWFSNDAEGCIPQDVACNAEATCNVASVTISGPQQVQDGSFIAPSFTLTAQGGTPSSYQWTWTAPPGVGNNPLVTFNPSNAATTETNSHWFANPDVPCPSPPSVHNPPVSSDPYYNAIYTIRGEAIFESGTAHQETTLTVNAYWNPAGTTPTPPITGGPTIGFDSSRGLWVVVNSGTITRGTPVPDIRVPSGSQFHNKTVAHENRHVQQYVSGMNSDLFLVSSLMAQLSPLTDPTQAGLSAKIAQAFLDWLSGQNITVNIRRSAMEADAYSVSDIIQPQYAYQGCQ